MKTACAVAAVALVLAGCAATVSPETDPLSPVAPRVQALVDANRAYPRWEDFPRSTQPLSRPVEVAARVNTLGATGAGLAGEVSRLEWLEEDPAAYEAGVRARIAAQPVAPASALTAAEMDAWAETQRRKAAAPPPIPRR